MLLFFLVPLLNLKHNTKWLLGMFLRSEILAVATEDTVLAGDVDSRGPGVARARIKGGNTSRFYTMSRERGDSKRVDSDGTVAFS